MPIYEYACPDCGLRFEEMQKFSDDPIRVCPTCKAENVKKLVSASAFVLKGGGWYKDHYGLKSGASESSPGTTPVTPAAPSTPAAAPSAPAAATPSTGSSSGS